MEHRTEIFVYVSGSEPFMTFVPLIQWWGFQ